VGRGGASVVGAQLAAWLDGGAGVVGVLFAASIVLRGVVCWQRGERAERGALALARRPLAPGRAIQAPNLTRWHLTRAYGGLDAIRQLDRTLTAICAVNVRSSNAPGRGV
jgi:hypothetical protein